MRFPPANVWRSYLRAAKRDAAAGRAVAQRLSVSTRAVRADIAALNMLRARMARNLLSAAAAGISSKLMIKARYQSLQNAAISRHGARSAHQRGADTLFNWRFLTSALLAEAGEDLADEWFCQPCDIRKRHGGRARHLQRYHLTLETRPRHGMKLFWRRDGDSRACLTDLLHGRWQQRPLPSVNC